VCDPAHRPEGEAGTRRLDPAPKRALAKVLESGRGFSRRPGGGRRVGARSLTLPARRSPSASTRASRGRVARAAWPWTTRD